MIIFLFCPREVGFSNRIESLKISELKKNDFHLIGLIQSLIIVLCNENIKKIYSGNQISLQKLIY